MLFEDKCKKDILLQRHGASGIFFICLLLWVLASLITILQDPINYIPVFFYSPLNAVLGVFFSAVFFYHVNFDIKLILEKEIKSESIEDVLYFFIDAISCITAVTLIVAILQLHLSGILLIK